jgi:hypothetical protein
MPVGTAARAPPAAALVHGQDPHSTRHRPGPIQVVGYILLVAWEIVLLDEVETWLLDEVDEGTYDLVAAAIDKLEQDGPTLGRPLVDKIKGSTLHNLKELRPGSAGTSEVRILFIFDPARRAVLLVAGDKSGRWQDWYDEAVPVAEKRYERWMEGEGDE